VTTTRGAIDGSGAFAFYIENTPIEFLTPGYSRNFLCGTDSLREIIRDEAGVYQGEKDPAGPCGAMLIPGISIVEFNPVTEDEAIGLSLTVHYKDPGPAKPEEHLLFSEVSVEFLKGDGAYLIAPMGERAGLDEAVNLWRLPKFGIWRVRAYGDYDFSAGDYVRGDHPDRVYPQDYKESGRTPESLPCQISLEFWPEKTLRDAVHKTYDSGDELITTPCTDYMLSGTPEEIAKRYKVVPPPPF